jgi:hypothetical protein
MPRVDKRLLPSERTMRGPCVGCGRRHVHKDDCPVLIARIERENDGTDPDQPPVAYAGGLLS